MSDRAADSSDRPLRHRKTRDRALILPLAGFILLMPPVADIFQLETRLAGVPFTAAYLFFVWALLIAGAAALSGRLRDGSERDADATPTATADADPPAPDESGAAPGRPAPGA